MSAGIVGLSLIAVFMVILAPTLGVRGYDSGIWPAIILLPAIGFPIGFLLMLVLMVLTTVRRSRRARG